jgi:hydroxymethylbilane synthase
MHCRELQRLPSLMRGTVTIGSRGSQLALWQANWAKQAIESSHPSLSVGIVIFKTKGDTILDVSLAKIGGKGLFVKEIEDALLHGKIDLAVHSMKDMPSELPAGLCIGAIPERENPADVLISRGSKTFAGLRGHARIGTSSLRRGAQLRHVRPDLEIVPLRGNIDTRLRKLETENLDAVVLAAAGIARLGFSERITEYLDTSVMLPAVGQGALCIEIRREDPEIEGIVSIMNHPATRTVVSAERAFLHRLGGSCQVPIAGMGRMSGGGLTLDGLVAEIDGASVFRDTLCGKTSEAEKIGQTLAERLLAMGAAKVLDQLKAISHEG